MVEQKPSKLTTRVRFPSPAPQLDHLGDGRIVERPERSGGATARGSRRVDRHDPRRHMARLPAPAGEVAEWLKAADCKSARASVRWFESSPLHQPSLKLRLASQVSIQRFATHSF